MLKVKYRMEDFLLFDYLAVERHLSNMAKKGWMLESAGPQLWKYRKAEPADITYAVTYISDASEFNPHPTDNQMLLEEYCGTAGWQKVCDWSKMQIFSTAENNPVPIETEESVRLELIEKVMEKTFLPPNLFVLVFFIFLSLITVHFIVGRDINSGYNVFDAKGLILFLMSILGVIVEVVSIANYFRWVSKSEKSIEQGGTCAENWVYRIFSRITWALIVVLFIVQLLLNLQTVDIGLRMYQILYFPMLLLLIFLVRRTQKFLRKTGVSKTKNIIITVIVDFILAFVLIGGMNYILLW